MSGTLVDTNVLLDVATKDDVWAEWSLRALDAAAVGGPLHINDVIYAEFSVGFTTVERVERTIEEAGLIHSAIPRAALFLAGKAFQRYRKRGGDRTGVLPDFFIGAHAAAAGLAILTRDARRYRHYFPSVRIIAP